MDLQFYFEQAIARKASDIHLVGDSAPYLRIDGQLVKLSEEIIDAKWLAEAVYGFLEQRLVERLENNKELDVSKTIGGSHFRINLHYQRGVIGLTARLISSVIPDPEFIGLNENLQHLAFLNDGFVLVVGPCGAGKSTTLASLLGIINRERQGKIITIEDPIEYIFQNDHCLIEQREIGIDTNDFAVALKYVLRQDPNVIMVGEMRDNETIEAALTAAETGHLVFSTLHTATAAESLSRIVSSFPAHQQSQIATKLSLCLRAVIAQRLLPAASGGRVAAREIMFNTPAIANLLRSQKLEQIPSIIQTSSREGMITFNRAIEELLLSGKITSEIAKIYERADSGASYWR